MRILQEIPAWGSLTLIFSAFAFLFLYFTINYVFMIVFALAAVEQPQNAILIPSIQGGNMELYRDSDSPTKTSNSSPDEEVLLVQQKPLTASVRSSINLLKSVGGGKARWRGISLMMVYWLCTALLTPLLSWLSPFGAAVIIRVLLCRWEMGWTHIVISNPSSDYWFRRLPPFKTWKKIWGPTALAAIVQQVAFLIPTILMVVFGYHKGFEVRERTEIHIFKLSTILLVALVCYFGLAVPAEVALTRVQASMLPENEESIVPFDRSFGGRVVSELDGGNGKLSFADAWRSFDKEAKARIAKLIVKIFMIDLALSFLYVFVLIAEVSIIVVPAMGRAGSHGPPKDDVKLF